MFRAKVFFLLPAIAAMVFPYQISAQTVNVIGGQTSVLLDTDLLSTAAGLDLSGVSDDVGNGNLGPGSVLFDINPRDSASMPSTFSYTPGDFAPFSGTVEHTGSVFFNNDTIEVGNFSIGFDANRVAGNNSGFFVESTTGISAILFDLGSITELAPTASSLDIEGSLFVSPEFANFLGDAGLSGADVGDARLEANSVPEPGTMGVLGAGVAMTCLRRKRR